MPKIRVVVCRMGKEPVVEEMDNTLKAMQELVRSGTTGDSFVESLTIGGGLTLYCNEYGLINNLPANRILHVAGRQLQGYDFYVALKPMDKADLANALGGAPGIHIIHGDFFIGRVKDGEHVSLTDHDLKKMRL